MLRNTIFLYDVFFYILHTIPLRMMKCSQGINQKKKSVFYSFGNHPLTDSTKSGEETNVTDHVLILATTS